MLQATRATSLTGRATNKTATNAYFERNFKYAPLL